MDYSYLSSSGDLMSDEIEEKLKNIEENINKMNTEIELTFKQIRKDIEDIVTTLKTESAKSEGRSFKPSILLNFPDHLRKTVRVLLDMGMGTAKDISDETKRSRSLESTYLNQLVTMGYVEKERKGQMVYYKIKFTNNPGED